MTRRLALITGGTSGIGKAACKLFAQKNVDLIITGRNLSILQTLQKELSRQVQVDIIPADLSEQDGRKKIIDTLHIKSPDLVINNAGFGLYGEALTFSTQEQVSIFEVNVKAVLEFTLEAARALISAGKKGVVLNVSSAAAFQVMPDMAVYAASKAFVNQFSQAFDFEVKDYGVRILTICPGMVDTEFQSRAGAVFDKSPLGVMTSEYVAEEIWNQIERLKTLSIIDWKYRFITFLSHLIPTSLSAGIVKKIIEQRLTSRNIIRINK